MSALKEVAEKGDLFGQHALGTVYKEGRRKLPVEPIQAKYWMEKAMEGMTENW